MFGAGRGTGAAGFGPGGAYRDAAGNVVKPGEMLPYKAAGVPTNSLSMEMLFDQMADEFQKEFVAFEKVVHDYSLDADKLVQERNVQKHDELLDDIARLEVRCPHSARSHASL